MNIPASIKRIETSSKAVIRDSTPSMNIPASIKRIETRLFLEAHGCHLEYEYPRLY